ncbi:MAG: DUF378 domain-containing protein [Firmicutes bacterium]|nr:DUF378 domain-containing protein [Bacillota bacterium]
MKMRDYLALTLVIVGALNWGLVGFFNFDLVSAIFGVNMRAIARIIFALVGLAGIYCLTLYSHLDYEEESSEPSFQTVNGGKR